MRILIETKVNASYEEVWAGFNQELFIRLSPAFPPVELIRFDGCKKGDEVHLRLNFLFFNQQWNSLIIESGQDQRGYYFIDQGTKLPFFLTYWEHKHGIRKDGDHTIIKDEIYFKAYNFFFELILFPSLWLSFRGRKPVYKQVFASHPF